MEVIDVQFVARYCVIDPSCGQQVMDAHDVWHTIVM